MSNALAYCTKELITSVKCFMIQAPGAKRELLFNKPTSVS
jgi:hypothetical protein